MVRACDPDSREAEVEDGRFQASLVYEVSPYV